MEDSTTILIVDDNPMGYETLKTLLDGQGYALAFAGNGSQALDRAAELIPDLILLDVMMPEMDGFEVCRRLRANPQLAEVPIILVTALDDRESRIQGLEAGADDFISKLFDHEELRARVRTITRLNRYRRLLDERAKFERVVELSPNGLVIVDQQGIVLLANPAALDVFGMSEPSHLVDQLLLRWIAPDQGEYWATCLRDVIGAAAQRVRIETEGMRIDGTRFPAEIDLGYFVWEGRPAAQVIIRDITERRTAQEQIQLQLQRMAALRTIDMAITASMDLRLTLNVLLDQVAGQLVPDATALSLLNPVTQILEYTVGRGFRTDLVARSRLRLGEGLAGRAALERRTIRSLNPLKAVDGVSPLLINEGIMVSYAVPLIAKGQVKGVLETFHRTPFIPDAQWLEFLETLAGQAAIAIDNTELFFNLQRSNAELALAYDTTIEGWSRALDMRDKETEGHTLRVTEMTLHLAREMGLREEELIHVRRGALLHDIGKMGIPDSILLKPGPLTPEEWEIMRQHPTYAYELISPIAFLCPSLDIPYCHHEKWDGTGYPRSLKGEQIPLPARIFAAVDVWDALRSDRPYRKGWSEDLVLSHILSLSGTHFDPQVVKVFLELVGRNSASALAI
ncbi:MAG TPA: HD domain-containing phosphohydrolase [Herpetosiphonaceae bacterium]